MNFQPNKQNILILGGAGFIGSALCSKLIDSEYYSVSIFEHPNSNLERLEVIKDKITVYKGYLSDVCLIKHIIDTNNIRIVIHLISTLIPGSTLLEYKNELKNVVLPTKDIISYCSLKNIKFVFVSSGGTIYGNSKDNRYKFKENDSLYPISYYGKTKLLIEQFIQETNIKTGLKYLVLRPSNAYGPGQNINGKQGLIAVTLGKLQSNSPITIWGDGQSIRDYIYIDDLVFCISELLNKEIVNETINIGTGIGYTVNEIIHIISKLSSKKFNIEYSDSRTADVNSIVLDTTLLNSFIHFTPTSISDGIKKFLNYLEH